MAYRRWGALLAVLAIFSMLLSACGLQTVEKIVKETVVIQGMPKLVEKEVTKVIEKEKLITATPAPVVKPKVLRINIGGYPDIIDPQKSSFVNEFAHLNLIYEGLTKLNTKLETAPGAAEKWEYNKDATELTFTLRKGLKYSDGSLLNAKRFEYAIKRNMDPDTAGEYAQMTDEIDGAEEWRTGAGEEDQQKRAEIQKAGKARVDKAVVALDSAGQPCKDYNQADCLALKLKLARPAPYYHTIMGMWVAFPAREENITAGKENWWNSSKWQIGNGPYVLASLEPFVWAKFTPNRNYWGGVAKINIEFSYSADSAVVFQAYRNNEIDIITLAGEDLGTVKADVNLSKEAKIYPGSCTDAVMFHQEKEPFNDPKVRQAFAMALDRDKWVSDVLKGLGSPTLTWIPKGFPGYKEGEKRWGFDPAAAKKALSESKYGSADKLPPIVATFSDSPRNRVRYEWLVTKWKENLGVTVKLNPVEPTTYTALTKDSRTAPQMYIIGYCADYPDPQNWLSIWRTEAFAEHIGYSNKELDKALTEADTFPDPQKRMELYQNAQDLLVADCPIVFMCNEVNAYLVKPWVKGIETTPQDSGWPGSYNSLAIDLDMAMIK